MHEILRHVQPSARVLDLGSNRGSFDSGHYDFLTVRADLDAPCGANAVRCDAALLPFRDHVFDAVISNHSLEHFDRLDESLREIGRVTRAQGALYVAVPDASTLADRIYRWLGRGGGHVNAFTSADELASHIEKATGLRCVGRRLLHTSLSFLNRRNIQGRPQRKLLLFARGNERFLSELSYWCRIVDRRFGTRLSVYGWAFWFGAVKEEIRSLPLVNVCVRCGAGHPEQLLSKPRWRCPACGAMNRFTPAQ